MPRFYFDFHDGHHCHEDRAGCELPDLQAAHALAVRTICDLQNAEGAKSHNFAGCGFVIENEDHEVLVVVPFDVR